jgi:hypothetical protein
VLWYKVALRALGVKKPSVITEFYDPTNDGRGERCPEYVK